MKIGNTSDLKNLCEVSRHIYEVVTPCLYESLNLEIDERSLGLLTHHYEGLPLEQVERYTKDISISVPFHKRLRKRCWHYNAEVMQHTNDEEDPSFDTMIDLDVLLTSLHMNELRSFK